MRSRGTGVHNSNSVHMIKWWDREKAQWTKNTIGQSPKDKNQRGQKPSKPRKYFDTP